MKLKEYIKKVNPEHYIKIGCTNGSGYIFIDRAKNLDFDKLETAFASQRESCTAKALTLARKEMPEFLTWRKYEKRTREDGKEPTRQEYDDITRAYVTRMKATVNSLRDAIVTALNCVPFAEREITETFIASPIVEDHTNGEPVTALMIPGIEHRDLTFYGQERKTK